MKQNFGRDKMRKEAMRKKKQEDKRNKRLHKKDTPDPAAQTDPSNSAETL